MNVLFYASALALTCVFWTGGLANLWHFSRTQYPAETPKAAMEIFWRRGSKVVGDPSQAPESP